MRSRLWKHILNVKFKALYTFECARVSGKRARLLAFALAITSGSGVASWALWKEHAAIWATIIAVGQLLQVAILYVPFLKSENELLTASFELENLYLKYEQLWYDFQDGTLDEPATKKLLTELRAKEIQIERVAPTCPQRKRWISRTRSKAVIELELDFF